MARFRKTYQSKHFQLLDTYVKVKGEKLQILFRGGSLKPKVNGKYTTEDQDIIAVLDADLSKPGCAYTCIQSEKLPEPAGKTGAPAKPAPEPEPEPEPQDDEPKEESGQEEPVQEDPEVNVPEGFTAVPGITTVQEAREYLLDNYPDIQGNKIPNGQAVKAAAANKQIFFTDLK